jgi:Coenzyme PQQ synthesis protein D (PqqD)
MEANRMATPRPHLRSAVDHDGAVILDIERDAMLTINSTGSYVWERLQRGKQIEEIIHELASETGADPVTVDRDVHAFLNELKSKHLFTA